MIYKKEHVLEASGDLHKAPWPVLEFSLVHTQGPIHRINHYPVDSVLYFHIGVM